MAILYTVEERSDERGILIFIVLQNGIELTTRWTRFDAETEIQRREAESAIP